MVPGDKKRKMRKPQETTMKVQTNLRAGKQNRSATSGSNSTDSVDAPEVYVVPVSRCVGI
jgi:hypothetical protein